MIKEGLKKLFIDYGKLLQKYPYTTKALVLKLKSTGDWDNLTVGDIRAVLIHSHVSIVDIQQEDLLWGDKFLVNEK